MKRIITIGVILLTIGLVGWAAADNFIGTGAGSNLSTGSTDNTAYGGNALDGMVTGKGNTALGMYAGYRGYDYDGTIKLGYMAGYSDTTSHRLFINTGYYPAYGIFGLLDTGKFGINNTSPTVALDVTGTISFSEILHVAMTYTPMPDTTGFTGGEVWGSDGDSLYIYNTDHTIGIVYGK